MLQDSQRRFAGWEQGRAGLSVPLTVTLELTVSSEPNTPQSSVAGVTES